MFSLSAGKAVPISTESLASQEGVDPGEGFAIGSRLEKPSSFPAWREDGYPSYAEAHEGCQSQTLKSCHDIAAPQDEMMEESRYGDRQDQGQHGYSFAFFLAIPYTWEVVRLNGISRNKMQPSANLAGQCLGHYRLIQQLGQGGFAEVYLAEHIHLKTQIAVKVLLTHLTKEAVQTFRHEAQLLARLRHPSIVHVHDFGIAGDTAYLVMDYAPHGTLRHLHPKGSRLPLVTLVKYVKQVAEALQYAHEQRLIHRDVKPENMLLGPQHEVLLSDFGIALTAHRSTSRSTQDVAGTIVYMAPEQIQGHAHPASDQYALGIVVYEWLCGNRPFEGTFTEIAIQHTLKAPPSLSHSLPTLCPQIEQVVMTALQKNPHQRFPTVRAFALALERQSSVISSSRTTLHELLIPPHPSVRRANIKLPAYCDLQ